MSSPDRPRRSHLFAPASNERIVLKALDSGADAVVLDLEDSIDQTGRTTALDILDAGSDAISRRPTHIRVGIIEGGYQPEDVELAARLAVEAVRLPKVESREAVASVGALLAATGSRASMHLTVESAAGLAVLDELIAASERVSRVVFGERDFLADMGVSEPGPITDHARGTIAITSRAMSLEPPIDGAFIDLDDDLGLRGSCERARSFGFGGKSALHPRQLAIIHEVFSPSQDEIKRAAAIVGAYDAARERGDVTTVVDGRFVDEAVARRARSVLSMTEVDT